MMGELLAQDEVMGCNDHMQVVKGKRTKRQRPLSPLALAMVSSCSSEGERFSDNSSGFERAVAVSPTASVELTTSTEEEEDMANCLILLARGDTDKKLSSVHNHQLSTADNNNKKNNNYNGTTDGMAAAAAMGLYVYQCKTCNRCFPSFQALGGHRASHKKPKPANEEKKAFMLMEEEDDHFSYMSTTLSLQITNRSDNLCASNKGNKVHECSICGAEFSSGQALGGHMRRHRAFVGTTTTATSTTTAAMAASSNFGKSQEAKKPKNILQLDLNLPAPEDDRRESKFGFASKEQVIVFSASSLVDCPY